MAHDAVLVILAAGVGSRFGGLKQLAPVGPAGETFLDYAAVGGVAGGFTRIAVVVRPEILPDIAAHIHAHWPTDVPVTFVEQHARAPGGKPLGTGFAILEGREHLDVPFAVVNADDVYSGDSYKRLHERLASTDHHVLIGFRLADTILTPRPLSRAICRVENGRLRSIDEGTVTPGENGSFTWAPMDGGEARPVPPDTVVSTNMLGFQPSFLVELAQGGREFLEGEPGDTDEFRLPDAVGESLERPDATPVDVITASGRSFGVTHREDLDAVRAEVQRLAAEGQLPERLWH